MRTCSVGVPNNYRASEKTQSSMMFVQSLHGISHNKIEDTKEAHLAMAVTAFDRLAEDDALDQLVLGRFAQAFSLIKRKPFCSPNHAVIIIFGA
jgi:hypothetical protein